VGGLQDADMASAIRILQDVYRGTLPGVDVTFWYGLSGKQELKGTVQYSNGYVVIDSSKKPEFYSRLYGVVKDLIKGVIYTYNTAAPEEITSKIGLQLELDFDGCPECNTDGELYKSGIYKSTIKKFEQKMLKKFPTAAAVSVTPAENGATDPDEEQTPMEMLSANLQEIKDRFGVKLREPALYLSIPQSIYNYTICDAIITLDEANIVQYWDVSAGCFEDALKISSKSDYGIDKVIITVIEEALQGHAIKDEFVKRIKAHITSGPTNDTEHDGQTH